MVRMSIRLHVRMSECPHR